MNQEENTKHFLAYNIISLIRDELPPHRKELVYQIWWFETFYKQTVKNMLKQDIQSLSLIRQADGEGLIELHKILVEAIELPPAAQ